jgi:hypothetical protein
LGIVSLLQGELDDAEQRFVKVARQNPNSIEARWFGGAVAWLKGEPQRAQVLCDEAHALARGESSTDKSVSSEGDTRDGQAMTAGQGVRLTRYLVRWKTLGDRPGEAKLEYDEAGSTQNE